MWNSKTRLPLLRNRLFGDFPDSRIYAEDSYFISRGLNSNLSYCAFHKHATCKVQKPRSQLRFSLPSIIITITSNEPWNRETHKTDQNPPITNHKPWPFEPVKVKFCFLRGLLRWLTAAKNAIVSWLLNFRIRMFVKSPVINKCGSVCGCLKNFFTFLRAMWASNRITNEKKARENGVHQNYFSSSACPWLVKSHILESRPIK